MYCRSQPPSAPPALLPALSAAQTPRALPALRVSDFYSNTTLVAWIGKVKYTDPINLKARFLLAPWGSTVIEANGTADHGPAMLNRPRRPPWSLVLPRCSAFLGSPDDDWQINASEPVSEIDGKLTVSLTNLEQPQFTGAMTVDPRHWIITEVRLGHMIQSLHLERTEPGPDDDAVLEDIKANVRAVSG